ncbi:MAG: hypothetical protein PHE50_00540, partial [Dehalococcoidales bacterium]|nr:hypothetical protein [Dehalococcoidales bacterium]
MATWLAPDVVWSPSQPSGRWKLKRVEFNPEEIALLDSQRFPKRTEALQKLKGYDVIHVHDD